MDNRFFEKPILNSPYKYPEQHWELDAQGQPTQQIIASRRRSTELQRHCPEPARSHPACSVSGYRAGKTRRAGFGCLNTKRQIIKNEKL